MNGHGALLIAALMISAATAAGLMRREQIETAAHVNVMDPPAASATPPRAPTSKPTAPAKSATTEDKVAVGTTGVVRPNAAPAAVAAEPAVAQPAAPEQPAPVARRQPNPPAVQPPAVAPQPTPPAATPGAVPVAPQKQVFNEMRELIAGHLQIQGVDVGDGGFSFSTAGVRLEAMPGDRWEINLYNVNAENAEVESEDFKRIWGLVLPVLGVDPRAEFKEVADGKGRRVLTTMTRLGRARLQRDPATGNACFIRPVGGPKNNPTAPNAPQPKAMPAPGTPGAATPGPKPTAPPAATPAPQPKPATDGERF